MKKATLLICLILMLLLTACGSVPERTETSGATEIPSSTDNTALKLSPEDRNQTTYGILNFIETEDGYYYPKYIRRGALLYFCPRGGDQFVPLCAKPNCSHSDDNCNAYMDSIEPLGYYDGALYTVEYDLDGNDVYNVVKRNLDGTDHSVVASVDNIGSLVPQYHRGKIFFHFESQGGEPFENRMIVVDLADGSESEPAADLLGTASFDLFETFYQNKAYASAFDRTAILNGESNAYQLLEYDLVTGKGRNLDVNIGTGIPCVEGSTLYWFESDKNYMGEKVSDVEQGFREYDLESGTLKNCGMPFEDANGAVRDADYIYVMGFADRSGKNRTLYFLSKDYKLVDQVTLEGDNVLAVAASDRVFVCDMDAAITGYIEKSAIGSGSLEMKPIQAVE